MKILIVEDELKTLRGIERLVNEIDKGYEIVGMAKNGKEGLEIALKASPDVIMTDIRMTQMSGLDMMKALREANFVCKYIVISGHADFDYAREALVLGSIDYLLKPMTKEMLETVLEKTQRMLEEEKASIRPSNLSKEELLEKILFGKQEEKENYFNIFKERLTVREGFSLLLIKGDNRFVQKDLEAVRAKLSRTLEEIPHIFCAEENHKEIYVFLEKDGEDIFRTLEQCMAEARNDINEYLAFAGKEFIEFEAISEAKKKLQDLINWNLTFPQNYIIRESNLAKLQVKKFNYPVEKERKIVKMIHGGEMETIESDMDEFIHLLRDDEYDYIDIREAMICLTVAMLYAIRTASYGLYENINNLNILEWVQNLLFVSHYRQIMINILNQYAHYSKNMKKSEHPTINKVLKIIDAEYKDDLTVESLAERMNITPEYLSSLFTKELGVKFTAYYTQRRIDAAKQMLASSNKKIYEVAVESGYNDVKYFCKVFKKYTGISPGEYLRTLE